MTSIDIDIDERERERERGGGREGGSRIAISGIVETTCLPYHGTSLHSETLRDGARASQSSPPMGHRPPLLLENQAERTDRSQVHGHKGIAEKILHLLRDPMLCFALFIRASHAGLHATQLRFRVQLDRSMCTVQGSRADYTHASGI
jgi:hypothetical protein